MIAECTHTQIKLTLTSHDDVDKSFWRIKFVKKIYDLTNVGLN